MKRISRAMFALVRYVEDGVYFVCDKKKIRNKNGELKARYRDGIYYVAEILICSDERKQLDSLRQNISLGYPKVNLILPGKPLKRKTSALQNIEILQPLNEMNNQCSELLNPSDQIMVIYEQIQNACVDQNLCESEPNLPEDNILHSKYDAHVIAGEQLLNEVQDRYKYRHTLPKDNRLYMESVEQNYDTETLENTTQYQPIYKNKNEMTERNLSNADNMECEIIILDILNHPDSDPNVVNIINIDVPEARAEIIAEKPNPNRQRNNLAELSSFELGTTTDLYLTPTNSENNLVDCVDEPISDSSNIQDGNVHPFEDSGSEWMLSDVDSTNDESNSICHPCYVEDSQSKKQSSIKQVASIVMRKPVNKCNDNPSFLLPGDSTDLQSTSTDPKYIRVECVRKQRKKYFCIYCKIRITNFARHLITLHKDEVAVKQIMLLPKQSEERKHLIGKLRNEGSFLFNTTMNYNDGTLLVTRRPRCNSKTAKDYMPCASCKAMFSKKNLKNHYRICRHENNLGNIRDAKLKSKQLFQYVNPCASEVVKKHIFPFMKEDEITAHVTRVQLVVKWANWLCMKYRSQHHHKMIRANLRSIGRFILEMKQKHEHLNNLQEICHPMYIDQIIEAINVCAGLDVRTGIYRAPSTAYHMGFHLKQTAEILIREYLKLNIKEKMEETKNFILLLSDYLTTSVNKTVIENQELMRRNKNIDLPDTDDINKLLNFVKDGAKKMKAMLKEEFTYQSWKVLGEYVLIYLQVFNRRRAGEAERMLIEDYNNRKSIDKRSEVYKSLSYDEKKIAEIYMRIAIRGKKGREVPDLITLEMVEAVDMILHFRHLANVPDDNPYVFGLPGRNRHMYHSANVIIRKFAAMCGAKNPDKLRGTLLRKHIATMLKIKNVEDKQVQQLANFMGHDKAIHHSHYRLTNVSHDITQMSTILENSLGTHNHSTTSNSITSINKLDNIETPIMSEQSLGELKKRKRKCLEYSSSEDEDYLPSRSNMSRQSTPFRKSVLDSKISAQRDSEERSIIKRRRWNSQERKKMFELFESDLDSLTAPSEAKCRRAQCFPELKARTADQIKVWVVNENNRHKKSNDLVNSSGVKRRSWSSNEKVAMKDYFKQNFSDKTLPSLHLCQLAKYKIAALSNRSPQSIKAYVNNEIVRMRKLGR